MDVSTNTALTKLYCYRNSLTELDVSANTDLTNLGCGRNLLTSLDVSLNTALTFLHCNYNSLTSLDVSANTALTFLVCEGNRLTSLNVRNGNNNTLRMFYATKNPYLTCIQVDDTNYSTANWSKKDATAIYREDCYGTTNIPDDNFEQALIDLGIDTNGKNGNILNSDTKDIYSLDVRKKGIANLSGIRAFTSLTQLNCRSNSLTSLDVSANTSLTNLNCNFNNLRNLNVSNNHKLTSLRCKNNELTSLNIKNGNNHNFIFFKSTSNPNLTCIQVDDASYSTANWLKIDTAASFSEDCSPTAPKSKQEKTISYFDGDKDFEKIGFSISPNPTTDILNITVKEKADYKLLNIRGQILKKGVLDIGKSKINLSSFAKGIYFLNIKTIKGSFTKKVVRN